MRTTRRLGPKALKGRQEWIETVTNTTESGDWDCLEEIYGLSNQEREKGRLGCAMGGMGLLSALRTSRPVHPSEDVMVACMSPYCHGFRTLSLQRTLRVANSEAA